jgi:hypothetical protein
MSSEQLADRATLLRVLTDAGWEPSRSDDAGELDAGRWLNAEVDVRYGRHAVAYGAAERLVHLRLEPDHAVARIGLVEAEVQGPVGPVAELVVAYQTRLSTEPVEFLAALVSLPGSRVRILKGQDWHVVTPDNVRTRLEPTFVTSELAEFDFYLGKVVDSSFFLANADLAAAHARCLQSMAARADDEDDLADEMASTTLEELFEVSFVDVTTDADGNIVGLHQGGDAWVLEHLDTIADLIRPEGYFLIQDDVSRYWRVDYTTAGARYCREPGP